MTWTMRKHASVLLATAVLAAMPRTASANAESARLRALAYDLAYNLEYDAATTQMEAAVKADPRDAAAERGLAVIPWLLISYSRGTATVDDYLGSLTRQNVNLRKAPQPLADRFTLHITRALTLAETAAEARPNDPEALYQLGAAVGLQATYVATIEGRVLAGFRAARRAYDAHERVLMLAPDRKDAGLTVGMYRYIVSAMSLPLRLLAYVAGFGGDKDLGLKMIEEAAATPGEAQADARFALVLLYNREQRYADALRTVADLQRAFPRNRLLWLEAGATALRAGHAADAERSLVAGMAMLDAVRGPRMFGEEALWYQKRGAARVALNNLGAAETDLRRSLMVESRPWVAGRAHAELGKIADLRGNRATARVQFEEAVRLAKEDNDPLGEAAAEPFVDRAFRR
jgi:tetratricopeptide (TPR) repeat protein